MAADGAFSVVAFVGPEAAVAEAAAAATACAVASRLICGAALSTLCGRSGNLVCIIGGRPGGGPGTWNPTGAPGGGPGGSLTPGGAMPGLRGGGAGRYIRGTPPLGGTTMCGWRWAAG